MSTPLMQARAYAVHPALLEKHHPVLARVYAARGVQSPEDCDYQLQYLLSTQQLLGLDLAVERLATALVQQERILVVGDFDADGATSSALAVSALTAFGYSFVDYLVPNRFEYGYGLTPEIVLLAQQRQPRIIITVDNGISSIEGVAQANALGIDVIITDHHLPGKTLPAACAIVNPNQKGCEFPSKVIAGVGVIFYVMCALRTKLREQNWFAESGITEPNMSQFLDLVALGTVADVVTLDYNNRILVEQGLKRLRSGLARVGIQALLQVSARETARVSVADLGFALAPRLNAAGRLTDMSVGIALLLSNDWQDALHRAKLLDELNVERRKLEKTMHEQAQLALAAHTSSREVTEQTTLQFGYSFYHPQWHQGVIGIIAGRLKEQLHRPVIVFADQSENELKGSARSIHGIHIRDVLESVATTYPTLLSKFGGHAMAAGMTIAKDDFLTFSQAFNQAVQDNCAQEDLARVYYHDGELAEPDISLSLALLLRDSGPWGQGFPVPTFRGSFRLLDQRLVGQKHLKMTLGLLNSLQQVDAIAFNVDISIWPDYHVQLIDCIYRLEVNVFNGVTRLQLNIEYFAACVVASNEDIT